MVDSSDQNQQRPYGLRVLGLVCFLSPLLYILSVGPATIAYTYTTSAQVQSTIEATYYPLKLLYENAPMVQPTLDWYLSLWS